LGGIFSQGVALSKIQSRGPVRLRPRGLFLPALALDRRSTTPLHEQVRAQLAAAVRCEGRSGARLPSTRLLARMLRVSRNTILSAYEELAAEGLIEGHPRSGMVIAQRSRGAMAQFDPVRVLREAQFPQRTVAFRDPDGSLLFLIY
jgi:DNA-binding transcriptional regulator YhcF (GntR family)